MWMPYTISSRIMKIFLQMNYNPPIYNNLEYVTNCVLHIVLRYCRNAVFFAIIIENILLYANIEGGFML
mgnify:CR=1 FL=1